MSVLLTTYNRPRMLAEAVESVLAQTYQDFELIILDDNSPPDSGVPAYLAGLWDDPRVVIYKSNVQPAERPHKTRYAVLANIGLALARGEYVTYLCDDDLYYPGRLQAMTARLDQGDCQVVYGSQSVTRDGAQVAFRPAMMILDSPACVVDHSSVMHTAQAAVDAGGWDDSPRHWNQADARFWERLVAAGHLFYPVQELTDEHRFHSGSVSEAGVPA